MAFDWAEYLSLAEQLSRSNDESSQRTAISRAYYFAFHAARDRASANNYRRSEEETTHNSLWTHYERNNNADCRRIAFLGKRLHTRRVRADYKENYDRIAEDMVQVLIEARRCAQIIKDLPLQYPEIPPPRTYSV